MEATYDVSILAKASFTPAKNLLPPCVGDHGRVSLPTRLTASALALWIWQRRRQTLAAGEYLCPTTTSSKSDHTRQMSRFRPALSFVMAAASYFIFFTASDVFNPLDGQRFDSPRAAQQAALRRIADVVSRKTVTQVNAASPNEIGEATGAKYASTAPQPGVRNRNARDQHAWNRP